MALGFLLVAALVTGCLPRASSVIYVPYVMEDTCDGLPRTVQLPATGPGSAIIVRSHQGAHYKSGLTCHFRVKTSSPYRIVVVFETLQFPGNSGNCSDSLLLTNVEQQSGPICTSAVKEVISTDNVLNLTWTTGGGEVASANDGFEAIVTAYKPGSAFCTFSEFKCANHRCIADNFACDGHNNCGDNSDEKCDFGTSFWRSMGSMSLMFVVIIVMGVCMVVPLIARVCFGPPDSQQQQPSHPNSPSPELPDVEDRTIDSADSDNALSVRLDRKAGDDRHKGDKKGPRDGSRRSSGSRGSNKAGPTKPGSNSAKRKQHEKTVYPRLQQSRERSPHPSRRKPPIHPEAQGTPMCTTTYRCMYFPPGKTLSSELPQRSPIFHVYGAAAAISAGKTHAAEAPRGQHSQLKSAQTPNSLRSPAPEPTRASKMNSPISSPLAGSTSDTPGLYVLRSQSNLSQDSNVKCGIREVSCGLQNGSVFTPVQATTCSTESRAVTPARVHRLRHQRRRPGSTASGPSRPATEHCHSRSGDETMSPPRSGGQILKGEDNGAYRSDYTD